MRLWRDHGDILVAELGKLEPPVWQLGGGTLLAKAWRHRLSFDLDITIPTGGSRRTEQAVLDAIETELRKRGLDVTNDPAERLLRAKTGVVDDYGNESGIDIWVHDPGLPGSARPEPISGTPVNRLSVAQIMHGKLQRDRMSLVRDAYDINYAHRADPAALETAGNSLTPEHIRRAEIVYATQSGRMDTEQSSILDWTGRPARDQQGCGMRAGQIIHDSRWIEVEITVRNGRIQATTTTTAGDRRDRFGPDGVSPEEAAKRLAEAGILDHLRYHYRGAGWTVTDVTDRIAQQADGNERLVRIAPAGTHRANEDQAVFTAQSPPEPPRIGGPRTALSVVHRERSRPGTPSGSGGPGGPSSPSEPGSGETTESKNSKAAGGDTNKMRSTDAQAVQRPSAKAILNADPQREQYARGRSDTGRSGR